MANSNVSAGKQEKFARNVSAFRKVYLKDEQKLSKMRFDFNGALRRQHTLAQEHLNTYEHASNIARTPRSKLFVKSVSFSKLLLKDEQKLAKKMGTCVLLVATGSARTRDTRVSPWVPVWVAARATTHRQSVCFSDSNKIV